MTALIAITPGEPAGVGPGLVVRLAQEERAHGWVVIADPALLCRWAHRLGLPLSVDDDLSTPALRGGCLTVLDVPLAVQERPGVPDARNASYVLDSLTRAAEGALAGEFSALTTGPVQKSIINDAGIPFRGHTEFFCQLARAEDVVMLLVAGELRVALATTHLPLAGVPAAITSALLDRRLRILIRGLERQFRISAPRVLVAGLNPHAGEGGHLGREEIEVIGPVCDALKAQGANLMGPLPADTLFTPAYLREADAVFVMYHDQGLPVLKALGFGRAVNVTLGLPFVRTSVDHGTALDLAGSAGPAGRDPAGRQRPEADPGSLAAALELAAGLSR